MLNSRMILLVASIVASLVVQTTGAITYPNIDEDTNCPLNVNHTCNGTCAEDQNRYGCYCELTGGDAIVTADIFTPCPGNIVDPCSSNPCQNGATCVREGLTSTKCTCAPGFGGVLCDTVLPTCLTPGISCPNAECIETSSAVDPVYCRCYDGSTRDPRKNATCPTSPCYVEGTTTEVCQNNGTCFIVNNVHVCECRAGYAGQNCTKSLKTPLCESKPGVCGEGTCQQSLTPPYYACNCGKHPNTFGKELDDLTKCEASGCYLSNPCLNGGTCSNKGGGAFFCQCPPRYTGSKCEKQSACYSNPCVNQGVCEAYNETVFFCTCQPYYSGQRCEVKQINPCLSKNCGPYGQCEDNQGRAVCRCYDGVHDETPCQSPCVNVTCGTGVCTTKPGAPFQAVCSCPINRQGDSCELSRDICRQRSPCGGGYCKPNYATIRGYSCVCEGGVVKNEPCPFGKTSTEKDCGTQGIYVETDGIVPRPGAKPINYVCSCTNGYITADSCDQPLTDKISTAAPRCGPNGVTYPSRNPNNPVGCWCNNGTQIEEVEDTGPAEYCL